MHRKKQAPLNRAKTHFAESPSTGGGFPMAKSAKPKKSAKAKKAATPKRPESQRICNLLPSRNTETDWRFENAQAAGFAAAPAALPASVDLRRTWWDVGNQ